jgi:ABC-type transport system involved in multi-copper enzyme maturation permease subunit
MSTSIIDRVRAADPERYARRLAPAGAVLCIVGAALANGVGVVLALVALTLLLVSCLSRDDGLLVFGPFARYELRRMAHHRRPPALWRALYAAAVLIILIGNVWTHIPHTLRLSADLQPADARVMQAVGQRVFAWVAVLQFAFLSYLTVQLFAPLVAEEREAKRLDFLFVTDLRNREILIGKALGRAPQLLDPILASLPILAVLPLLGGVPPTFVVAAAGATLATVLGLAGVSFFCSIVSPTGRKAVEMVYGLCFAYFMFSGVLWAIALKPQAWTFPTSVGLNLSVEVSDIVIAASAGNPLVGFMRMVQDINAGADTETRILDAVQSYSLFQMSAFACFGLMAVARLRQAKVVDVSAKSPHAPAASAKPAPRFVRPPVTDEPVAWHERYRETKLRALPEPWSNARWQFAGGIVVVVLAHTLPMMMPRADEEAPKIIVLFVVWVMGIIALLGASGKASATVARERERDTLEGLMLTGLGCREILRQKWLGCVRSFTGLGVVLLGTLTGGVIAGVIHPASALLLAVAVTVHATVGASVGLVFSVVSKTPAKAARKMWLTVIGTLWAGSIPVIGIMNAVQASETEAGIVAVVVFPPGATGAILWAFEGLGRNSHRQWEFVGLLVAAIAGTVVYAALAKGTFALAVWRFEREWEGRA